MSRKSIYDIIENAEFNPSVEYARLRYRFDHDGSGFYPSSHGTVYERARTDVLDRMPIKGTCINLNDLLQKLGIDLNKQNANMDDLFNLIEFLLCVVDSDYPGMSTFYNDILENINIILDKTSHKIVKTTRGRVVVPISAKIEQASILVNNEDLSIELLNYNHRSNIGNLKAKQTILAKIGKEYEPRLKEDGSQLSKDIRFLLNNIDIRHNNTAPKNNRYHNAIKGNEENWCDKLYSLFIAYIIENDVKKISEEISKLKK